MRSIGGSVLVSEGSFNVYLGSKRDGFQENSNNYSIGNHFFKVLVQIHYSLFIHYRPGLVIIFYPSISFYSIFAIVGFIVHDKVRELGSKQYLWSMGRYTSIKVNIYSTSIADTLQ